MEKPEEIKTPIPKGSDYNFMHWMKSNNYALTTIKRYHINVRNMIGKQSYISPEKIKKYLSNKNTLSKRASMRLLLEFLDDMEDITIAAFRYPRLRNKSPPLEVVSKDSFDKILLCMREDFKLFTKVMYYGALRLSETILAKTEDFNWQEWMEDKSQYGQLKVMKAKGNKQRLVPIKPELMQEILDYAPRHEDGVLKKGHLFDVGCISYKLYVFRLKKKGYSLEATNQRYVDKCSRFYEISLHEASNKAIGRNVKTHMLRSSRTTHLDEAGVQPTALQYLLGHDNLSTTSKYIVNTPEKLKTQIEKADEKEVKNER